MSRPFETLSQILSNHFTMHRSRVETLAQLILSMITIGNVSLSALAAAFDSPAKRASCFRRLQRFFQLQDISMESVAPLLFSMLPLPDKLVLTMDRTNWKFGKTDVNFLTLAFVWNGVSVPFLWTVLDHPGNSNTQARIGLMEKALAFLGPHKIHALLADREFIGEDWFRWLRDKKIGFCIRLKSHTQIRHQNGGKVAIRVLCRPLKPLERLTLENQTLWGCSVELTALRLADGELLLLAKSHGIEEDALPLYRKRWTIECLFKALKTQGFNLENTRLKDTAKLSKMMAVCAMAFAWAVKIGQIKDELKPIKVKNHGRPLFSLFTYGLQTLQSLLLKTKITKKINQFFKETLSNTQLTKWAKNLTVVY